LFRFQSLKKALNQGIVATIPFSAHVSCNDFTGINQIGKLFTGILDTSVRIKHQFFFNAPAFGYTNLAGR